MRTILLVIVACFLVGCLSSTREREAHCLGVMMSDVWRADDDFKSAARAWRIAQQTRFERSQESQDSSIRSSFVSHISIPSVAFSSTPVREEGSIDRLPELEEERTLYRQVVAAQLRQMEAAEWYGRVARRVQTRMEEDEMLNPVLGTLVTSTAIVFYPFIRWNVRSVLWEGVDPDAADDPVQVFCATRLERDSNSLLP
jgi:hypothetical protein